MGTKVINPKPDVLDKDIQTFKRYLSIKGCSVSKVTSQLINLQVGWIKNEGQQGINRSKDLFFAWRQWITSGCKPGAIPPPHRRHSLHGRLRPAMVSVAKAKDESEKVVLMNLISTSLRFHELYGPASRKVMKEKWEELRATITASRDESAMRCAFENAHDMSFKYREDDTLREYQACRIIKKFLDNYWRFASKDAKQPRKPIVFRHELSADPDSTLVLVKNSPHLYKVITDGKAEWKPLISVIGQPLDVHALSLPQEISGSLPVTLSKSQTFKFACLYDVLMRLANEMCLVFNGKAIKYAQKVPVGNIPEHIQVHPGRIVPIEDKAGKVRPVATTCYTVNEIVSPLHRFLFAMLSQLPCDSTEQSYGLQRIIDKTGNLEYAVSDDLTSATDTMPRYVQSKILSTVLAAHTQCTQLQASKISTLWELVFGNLRFLTPDGDYVTYGRGQAMGCYTSWPVMALMNHFVALAAAYHKYGNDYHKMNTFLKEGYTVCGDDIVIFDREVALIYEFIMNSLGVKINKTKSFESNLDEGYSRAEFCKKLAVNGSIVSGVSPKALFRAGMDKGQTLIPAAIDSLKTINGGLLLSKRCLDRIASRYPRQLHNIPLEYGGLGFVNDVPKSKVLAQNGFIIAYHYYKLKALMAYGITAADLKEGVARDTNNPFYDQLALVDELSQFESRLSNKFSDGKPLWTRLGARDPLAGCLEDKRIADDLLLLLERWVKVPDAYHNASEVDIYFVVDNLPGIYKKLFNNLFVGTPTKASDINPMRLIEAKAALKVAKQLKRTNKQGEPLLAIARQWDQEIDSNSSLVLELAYMA